MYGLATDVEELRAMMLGRVEEVLRGVMADERVFVTVAGNGAFSAEVTGGVAGLVKVLEMKLGA